MTIVKIREKIFEKLKAMTGDGQPFAVAYKHHKLGVDGYPALTFEPNGIISEIKTTTENFRNYSFDIVIQQEISTESRESAIDSISELTDFVINAFDEDFTLGGLCEIVDAAGAEIGEVGDENSIIIFSKIMLYCKVLHPIY